MLKLAPFFAWLAAIASAVLLIVLWNFGESRRRFLVPGIVWFLIAAYCQFFAKSVAMGTAGLVLQTVLAVVLLIRWRLA